MNRCKQKLLALAILGIAGTFAAVRLFPFEHGAQPSAAVAATTAFEPESATDEPIDPLPRHIELDARKVALGKRLFHETRLSADNTVSCSTCHDLKRGGTDRRETSIGIRGGEGDVNAPTVFNSGFNFRQFWDGRAESLEDQIDGPIHNPVEMSAEWPQIVEKLKADADYPAEFSSSYAEGITSRTIKDAIATFERSLVTPDGRFDRYLRGDAGALTADEAEGYRLFKSYGCSSCHQGVLAGGNMFEKLGIVADYLADRGRVSKADLGRFNVTGVESDRYKFKVPGLRNVARTAPYFHDGSAKTLEEAVSVMANYQLGRELSSDEIGKIVQFLKTLNGESAGGTP